MPVMNGFEATSILKSHMNREILPNAKIIACTAYTTMKELD